MTRADTPFDDLLTTQEAAKLLKKSPRTLETWRQRPKKLQPFGYFHDGYRIWYSRSDIEAYLQRCLVRMGPAAA